MLDNGAQLTGAAAKGKDSRQALEAMLTDRSKSLEDSIKPVPVCPDVPGLA
jgi:hypothetical protein